jgi:hypothetical protein
MPLVQTRGAASAQGFGEFSQPAGPANYIDDVFSTFLYTGTGANQTITNDIQLGDASVFAAQSTTAIPAVTNRNNSALAANSSIAVAFGYIGSLGGWQTTSYASTADGVTWTSRTMPVSSAWFAATQGNGTFVVASFSVQSYSVSSLAYYSTDGLNWSSASGFPTNFSPDKAVYTNSQFFLVGEVEGGGSVFYKSSNGASWSSTPSPSGVSRTFDIAYGNGTYVVISGSNSFTSTDLSSWSNSVSQGGALSICFGNGVFILGTSTGLRRSTDGISWTTVSGAPTYIYDAVYDGTKFIGVTNSGTVVTSTDGLTWSVYQSAVTDSLARVALLGTKTVFMQNGTNNRYAGVINSFTPSSFGKGGMVWLKSRSAATNHFLFDTTRGVLNEINSNTTDAQASLANSLTAFNSNGFNLGSATGINVNAATYCSWTFREQPKFFDVVTYTGTGSARTISHNLGSAPGMIIVKAYANMGSLGNASAWNVYHRSLGNTKSVFLNSTSSEQTSSTYWNNTSPTSSVFTVGTDTEVNASGVTYVAYLFAHDAGGFGTAGTDNVISCGSYTGNGSATGPVITLGYEPQYLLVKRSSGADNWILLDMMRGMPSSGTNYRLFPNLSDAETGNIDIAPLATGFQPIDAGSAVNQSGQTYIYMAIRRPMKVPTAGTSVFQPILYTGNNTDNRLINTGIVTDMTMARRRNNTSTGSFYTADRLRGNASLGTAITDAENTDADSFMTPTLGVGNSFSAMNGFGVGNDVARGLNGSSTLQLAYAFQRRPGFFDEVCYTGTGSPQNIAHNLGVAPELIITKTRGVAEDWGVYSTPTGNGNCLFLNTTGLPDPSSGYWNNTTPTSTVFTVGSNGRTGTSGRTYVAYLFASCPGVSKVGSYTGTGATQTINAALPTGARFVFIKRTDSTGEWWVFDTASGMVSGNNPRLAFNLDNSQIFADWVFTVTNGFQIVTSDATVNASGGSYIYLAIA